MVSRAFAAALALTLASASAAFSIEAPSAQCVLNANKSHLTMVTQNTSDKRYACNATCQYSVAGQRQLQTFDCDFEVAAHAGQEAACDLTGTGPDHFGEVEPTKFACQPQ